MTTQGTLTQQTGDYSHLEPLPDPPREPDMQQTVGIVAFHLALRLYFARRDDVLISGEGFLRHEATNNAERLAPDCVVAFGVSPEGIVARNGYVISEVGKPPDFVLEVASRSTGRRDYTVKREGYAGYGVGEYWRFDHTGGEFHDAPLAGDILVGDEYQPIEIHEGSEGLLWGHSAVLGLDLCWDDGELRLRDPLTGEFLRRPEELQAEAEAERAARETAEARAESERAARQSAEARVAELEAELRRLRGE
jgi:Uma2 family endonuclease